MSRVVELIRGPKGSTVRLTIIPVGRGGSAIRTVSFARDDIKLTEGYAKAVIIDLPQTNESNLRIGIISLPSFYEKNDKNVGGASADCARLIGKLKQEHVAGLILDLRCNGGGSLQEAIRLTGLFIPSAPVVQTRDASGNVKIENVFGNQRALRRAAGHVDQPADASSSEIVAGALQDYGRALIVGDSSTFGKGTVQTVVPLRQILQYHGLGAVKVTIGKFYRPNGGSTQIQGVVSDIVLPSETDMPGIGEAKLPNALSWDALPPATFTNFNLVRPILSELRDKSRARITSDPGFRCLREELAKTDEAASLSLNEATRRRENANAGLLKAEMDKISRDDSTRMSPTYDITLADIGSSGLHAPRGLARSTSAAGKLAGNIPDDIELHETENILADYIHALRWK